jgi:hypothetical protein
MKREREREKGNESKREKRREREPIDAGDLSLEQQDILILRCVN